MGVNKIMELVQNLPYLEQLKIAEAILHSILERAQKDIPAADTEDARLAVAAEALFKDYVEDEELTIFTNLDGDVFYEQK
jgi:hypothetical protein